MERAICAHNVHHTCNSPHRGTTAHQMPGRMTVCTHTMCTCNMIAPSCDAECHKLEAETGVLVRNYLERTSDVWGREHYTK